jgi:hypothetical protein
MFHVKHSARRVIHQQVLAQQRSFSKGGEGSASDEPQAARGESEADDGATALRFHVEHHCR